MKFKTTVCLIFAGLATMLTACDDDKATQPTAAVSIEKNLLEVNESMAVHFVGNADNVVVYPGDPGHDYELREESNTGLVVNKNLLTYSYSTPGTYKVVCVATNHADEGKSILSDTCSVYIKVIDDCTEIERISTTPLYDEVFAERLNPQDWLIAMPRKIKFKTATPSVSLSQKLKFYISSPATKVYIDGADYNANSKYNLAQNHAVKLVSDEGTSRDYNLYTLNYGEFKSFKVAGVTGAITRTEFDYTRNEIDIQLPTGTDLTKLEPNFTLYADNEKVYIGDAEQTTGSTVDFTSPVTYRFVVTSTENPEVSVESTCVVTITSK